MTSLGTARIRTRTGTKTNIARDIKANFELPEGGVYKLGNTAEVYGRCLLKALPSLNFKLDHLQLNQLNKLIYLASTLL